MYYIGLGIHKEILAMKRKATAGSSTALRSGRNDSLDWGEGAGKLEGRPNHSLHSSSRRGRSSVSRGQASTAIGIVVRVTEMTLISSSWPKLCAARATSAALFAVRSNS